MKKLLFILCAVVVIEVIWMGYLIRELNKNDYVMIIPQDYWSMLNANGKDLLIQTIIHYAKEKCDGCEVAFGFYEYKHYYKIILDPRKEVNHVRLPNEDWQNEKPYIVCKETEVIK